MLLRLLFIALLAQSAFGCFFGIGDDCPTTTKAPAQPAFEQKGFDEANQQYIVDCHNTLRSTIAKGDYVAKDNQQKPAASNMKKMTWSSEIQKSAQARANLCVFQHTPENERKYGENLYMTMVPIQYTNGKLPVNGTGIAACNSWKNEFQTIGWPGKSVNFDDAPSGSGHATQMAWADSNQIGCGVAQCTTSVEQQVYIVCQYNAPGNYINTDIYKPGETCSACESSCDTASGLCA